jgi:regulator of microtubule dynamics RMD1/3-like protein
MADATASNEKLRLGRIALNYAERAAALAPNDSEAQLSIAISYGKMLPLLGIKEQIEASRRIKDTADNAIRLDPNNDLAWHVLGRWNRVLADVNLVKRGVASLVYGNLPQTTTEEAVRCFKRALELLTGSCIMLNWEEPTRRWDEPLKRGNLLKRDCRCRTWRKTIRKPNVADERHWRRYIEFSADVFRSTKALPARLRASKQGQQGYRA